jgi:hypothetical protein
LTSLPRHEFEDIFAIVHLVEKGKATTKIELDRIEVATTLERINKNAGLIGFICARGWEVATWDITWEFLFEELEGSRPMSGFPYWVPIGGDDWD